MIVKSHGWTLWENVQAALDRRFKAAGRHNAAGTRRIPLEQPGGAGTCLSCGRPAKEMALFAQA
jgi:hypothetical protein